MCLLTSSVACSPSRSDYLAANSARAAGKPASDACHVVFFAVFCEGRFEFGVVHGFNAAEVFVGIVFIDFEADYGHADVGAVV